MLIIILIMKGQTEILLKHLRDAALKMVSTGVAVENKNPSLSF